MTTLRRLAAVLLGLALGASGLMARGGGGCLERGTLIDTPNGPVPVEQLRVGDTVWGLAHDQRIPATVEAVYAVEPQNYVELTAGGMTLCVTPEHPVQVAPGVFLRADHLTVGGMPLARALSANSHDLDNVSLPAHGRAFESIALESVRRVPATVPAYNLLVSPGGVFFANGFAVHNKGCFLPDTPITMADGSRRAISNVQAGDQVLAFEPGGAIVHAVVNNVITHKVESFLVLRTEHVELRVTEEHPFYVGNGMFKTAEALRTGDTVYVYDGSGLAPQRVLTLEHVKASVTVYNLQTDAPHTFLANGVAVHNKGGGFGGGGFSGSGYYSGGRYYGGGGGQVPDSVMLFLTFGSLVVVFVAGIYHARHSSQDEELDYCFSRSAINRKAGKTLKLLAFISKVDAAWTPDDLSARVRMVFTKLQACWTARDYTPMEPLMMRDLYEEHCAQLRGLIKTHEINCIDYLKVEAIDLVHVNYTDKKENRTFTALITANARDYYVDDRTQSFLRGDEEPQRFQEFWTFQLSDGAWDLREIEQSKESDVLTTEDLFEQFTDTDRDQIIGKGASATGPAGPALPADVQAKGQKIDRLLNFLVQTDKIWDRDEMIATARRVFLNVQLTWQDGRPEMLTGLAADDAMIAQLRAGLETNQRNDVHVEHRNLCVRKVEIVHVDNRDDKTLDQYTARITAHAQTIITHAGTELKNDEFVKPWTEFWTFGRDGVRWVLKEILPEASGEATVAKENVDEGSSQQMLEWYYSKPRAT
jgi:predicted lipid-binding transport protein (Tim44 family)